MAYFVWNKMHLETLPDSMLSLLVHTIRSNICIHIYTLHTHYNSPSLREDREHEVGSCHKQCS